MSAIRKRQWSTETGLRTAWQAAYSDQAGKRRTKQFQRKKDAELWLAEAKHQVRQGTHTPDSTSISVEEAADKWLEAKRAEELEPTTVAGYEQHIRLHIVPLCGTTKLSRLTTPMVHSFRDQWTAKLSRQMVIKVLRSFKAILTHAQIAGHVAQNVAEPIKAKRSNGGRARKMIPQKRDLKAILNAAEGSADVKGRAVIELSVFAGLRSSELRGLPWSAIDLDAGCVTVSQRADRRGVIGPPKSRAGNRSIPLPQRVVLALKQWRLACPPSECGLVFPSIKGKVISHRMMDVSHYWKVQRLAGVVDIDKNGDGQPRYSSHDFRHAAASLWIESGLNPKRVQYLMGHESIQVTFDTYGHLFEQAEKDRGDATATERALFSDAT